MRMKTGAMSGLGILALTAVMTVVTIVVHELAHFGAAISSGARGVSLHWADISYEPGSLSSVGEAVTWGAGPLVTHAIIIWALVSRSNHIAVLALGLGAASRNLVLLPFAIKSLLGRDTTTFTNDEVTVGQALGLSPLVFAVPAIVLSLLGLFVFLRRCWRSRGGVPAVLLILGVVLGIVLWSVVGPVLLPGGKGLD